jgi:hypothetical protein
VTFARYFNWRIITQKKKNKTDSLLLSRRLHNRSSGRAWPQWRPEHQGFQSTVHKYCTSVSPILHRLSTCNIRCARFDVVGQQEVQETDPCTTFTPIIRLEVKHGTIRCRYGGGPSSQRLTYATVYCLCLEFLLLGE